MPQQGFRQERLRYMRKSKKLTMEELAKLVNSTKGSISNYENGHSTPPDHMLSLLADVLNTTTDYLLGRTDNPTSIEKTIGDEIADPELGIWFKELLEAPEEKREELKQIWDIIKQREAGRKPGDKQQD